MSEVEGGAWKASPGATKKVLIRWMDQQEDRVEKLGRRLEQNQRELTRLAEVEEEEGAPAKTRPSQKPDPRLNQDPESTGQVEESCTSEEL